MTDEQKAAYVFANAVAAQAEIEGMKSENRLREFQDLSPAYGEKEFMEIIDKYGLYHNAMLSLFHN